MLEHVDITMEKNRTVTSTDYCFLRKTKMEIFLHTKEVTNTKVKVNKQVTKGSISGWSGWVGRNSRVLFSFM